MRFTIDSNILVYAADADTPAKHDIARDILLRAEDADSVLTVQALGEFLSVIGRKYPIHLEAARGQAKRWVAIFPLLDTTAEHILSAADFASRYRLQFWDSLIWQVARSADATLFLSEDLQDGLSLEGMTVINPFIPENGDRLEALLAGGRD